MQRIEIARFTIKRSAIATKSRNSACVTVFSLPTRSNPLKRSAYFAVPFPGQLRFNSLMGGCSVFAALSSGDALSGSPCSDQS
jgi:hypothetical protein